MAVWACRGGGTLLLPKGTSIVTQPIRLYGNTIIQGQGVEATKIVSQAQNGNDVFVLGDAATLPSLVNLGLRDFSVETGSSGGGHIFRLDAQAEACSWLRLRLVQNNPAKQIFRGVNPDVSKVFFLYDSLWDNCTLVHHASSTVPAFEVSGPNQPFNVNTLRNLFCSTSASPFFRFETGNSQLNNGCLMSQIRFVNCFGGMVHWITAANWVAEDLVQQGNGTYVNDGLLLGKGLTYPPAASCRHMTLINCNRPSGTLAAGKYDIHVQINASLGPGATDTVVINCFENAPSHAFQASDQTMTWIGGDGSTAFLAKVANRANVVFLGGGKVYAAALTQPVP